MNAKRLSLNLIGQLTNFICGVGISFILTPYIVATLGKETYGFVGLANNVIEFITLFTIALNGMLSRYITVEYGRKDYEEASVYFSTALYAQGILALLLVLPMSILARYVDYVYEVPVEIAYDVRLLWLLVFISFLAGLPMGVFSSATFATNHLEIQAIINVLNKSARTICLLVTFVFFTPRVWYIGLASIASGCVSIVLYLWTKQKLMPEVKIRREYFKISYINKMVIVGVWNSLNKLQQLLITGLDLTITNICIDASQMGLLSIAKTVPTQISTLISAVSGTYDPTMTLTYAKNNMEEFVKQVKRAMRFCGFICSIPILGFIAFGQQFYHLWMPSLSDADITKIYILAILTMLPQVFSVYIYPLYAVNTITTKLKVPVLVSLCIGILNVFIVLILLKTTDLGVYAVAGVSSILWVLRIFIFVPIYAAWTVKCNWKVFYEPLIKGVINICCVGGLFVGISKLYMAASWIELFAICVICACVGYVICAFIVFDRVERELVLKKLRNKITRKDTFK